MEILIVLITKIYYNNIYTLEKTPVIQTVYYQKNVIPRIAPRTKGQSPKNVIYDSIKKTVMIGTSKKSIKSTNKFLVR